MHDLYSSVYLFSHLGIFFTYDWAHTTGSGGYRVLGRMDDAIRVKGVWLDIPEIESAMVSPRLRWGTAAL